MTKNSENKQLQLSYTSADGTKFYSFADPLSIGAIRGVAADKARRFADLNITERSLKELIKDCKRVAGEGDLVKAFWVIQEIEFRLNFICEEKSILDLVCIYFMLEDEDPDMPSEAFNKKKHKVFEADPKASAFFLRIGVALMNKLSERPEEDSLAYLEENRMMSQRIRKYIAEESLITSMDSSTS